MRRKLFLYLWLLTPVVLLAYHYGPGQSGLARDAAAQLIATARACGFDQLIVALGGSADEVAAQVDLGGATVVRNPGFGSGCGSSIAAAMEVVDGDVLVLMLGDQPGVTAATARAYLKNCARCRCSARRRGGRWFCMSPCSWRKCWRGWL